MTKKDIMEWLEIQQAKRKELAKQEHHKNIEIIRENILVKYDFYSHAHKLESLIKEVVEKHMDLDLVVNPYGFECDQHSISSRIDAYTDVNMIDYLFSQQLFDINSSETMREHKRHMGELIEINANYNAVFSAMVNCKNTKECVKELNKFGFDITNLTTFAENPVFRGTDTCDLTACIPSEYLVTQNGGINND